MTVKFVLAVLCMAAVTYFTRVFGYLVLHDRKLSPTVQKLMEASPGCVLISVVAPYFATTNPADLESAAASRRVRSCLPGACCKKERGGALLRALPPPFD